MCVSEKIQEYRNQIASLERQLLEVKLPRMSIERISSNPKKMLLYTSLSYDVFIVLSHSINRFQPLSYYYGWRVSSLSSEDQLLLALMKLRLNCKDLDLAERFCISKTSVSNIFHTYICALHEILFEGILEAVGIPSQAKCKGSMPKSFEAFPSARLAIDCTEITQDVPTELNAQSLSYSSYKSRHTVKALTGVAPNGTLVYTSQLYPGSVSDAAIVEHSGVLKHFCPGDLILADKGFNIFDKLQQGVHLNIPPFLGQKQHFTKQEAEMCFKIARSRIHVERANERIKNYNILDHIPAKYRSLSTKIFQVCVCLVNLQSALLNEIAENYVL